MKKVLIAAFNNTGNETESIRQVLESFGFSVFVKYIGRPNHFIEVLEGKIAFNPNFIILSCHGEEGRIIMPVLADSVYLMDEPKLNFSEKEIIKYLKISEKIIISTGCFTGTNEMISAFSNNQNTYIAPKDYIEGSSALFFVINFFYKLLQDESIKGAFEASQQFDKETFLFTPSNNLLL